MWKLLRNGETPKELEDLKGQLRDLVARMGALELEWQSTFRKLQRIAGHINKTQALDLAQQQQPAPPQPPQEPVDPYEKLSRDEIANWRIG